MCDETQIRALVADMASGWARADGSQFARSFSADADFTSVRGDQLCGRDQIAAAHQRLFDAAYRGTHLHAEVTRIRPLRPGLAVVGIDSRLCRPDGAAVRGLTGTGWPTMHALAVVENLAGAWQIIAFHNMVPAAPAG